MNILFILLVSAAALWLGGRYYAPVIARVLGERADRPTPAVRINDGRDYVPTRTPVVFAHHYASIAGAGPIVGPILAIYYGWLPALLWILLGGVFLGAVHDYVATHISLREGGKNLAVITRRYIGGGAFVMMLCMLVALLVLVCAAFLDLSAKALTSEVAVETLHITPDQKLFRVRDRQILACESGADVADSATQPLLADLAAGFAEQNRPLSDAAVLATIDDGTRWRLTDGSRSYTVQREAADQSGQPRVVVYEQRALIGGIASTSVVVITLFSPLIGFLYLKRKVPVWICSLLAIGICALSIFIGTLLPMPVSQFTWKMAISAYVLISAGLPVWLFLQSRDFINVHILYIGIAFLVVALLGVGLRGGGALAAGTSIPASNWTAASTALGPGWPVLFVMIACGAVSGFHSLCAGGTTSKQLSHECAARHVGYYGMLLECFLAVCVVACVLVGLSMTDYELYRVPGGQGNAVLTFAMSVGHTAHIGLGLPIAAGALGAMLLLEGFLVTTLDTAIRLTRYMIEEGWATFFGRYDVFAEKNAHAGPASGRDAATTASLEMIGTGGLTAERPDLRPEPSAAPPIPTRGAARFLLRTLQHYWVNSGIAVVLMLALALTNGYEAVWKIFGSSNQLLAALALLVATCWLAAKQRPLWYTLLPAIFMFATSIWMLVRLLTRVYIPGGTATAPLTIAAILVLAMTTGILLCAARRLISRNNARATVLDA